MLDFTEINVIKKYLMKQNELDALYNQIIVDEARLRAKKRKLMQLAAKYSKRSLSQMFPAQSAVQSFTIDQRQDI